MTPKEKAQELVREFKKYAYYPKTKDDEIFVKEIKENSKQCALIAVDFAIEYNDFHIEFLQEIKQEIEKL
jgi:hypothetical protein